jgi:large subunit ribosomal protein L9
MQVILKQDVQKLGSPLDVVNVKDGFARNFLIPQGLAVPASDGNMKQVAEAKKQAEKREDKKLKNARVLAKKIEKVPCTIAVKVKENEEIFGSVGVQEIFDFLKKEGFEVEKNTIELEEPIKQLGVYTVQIKLYKDASAKLKVWVVKEENA